MEGDIEGAVWICESPTTFEGRGRWSALEIVENLVDDTLVICLGGLCAVSDVGGGVVELPVLANDGAEFEGRPTFPRDLLPSGRLTEPESDSRLKEEYVRSMEFSGGVCG